MTDMVSQCSHPFRPLLEVHDLLHEKPDKRSIITYVSQFLHAPGADVASTSADSAAPIKVTRTTEYYRSLIEWIQITRTEMEHRMQGRLPGRVAPSTSGTTTDFEVSASGNRGPQELLQWYSITRKEFLERRMAFDDLRKHKSVMANEDWESAEKRYEKQPKQIWGGGAGSK